MPVATIAASHTPAFAVPAAPRTAPGGPGRYCVIGNPVEHSRSPWIHARFAALTGQALDYQKMKVELGQLPGALAAFAADGGKGCNITVPFKFEAFALAQHRSPRAMLAGAANTLRFAADGIYADNTDGAGLVADIERNAGITLAGRDVLLIGAGGAAAGALGPLLMASPRSVTVVNRSPVRAAELVVRHTALAMLQKTELIAGVITDKTANFDVIINASASSLGGAAVPVAAQVLRHGALAVDMMYGPAAQPFMDWAMQHGGVPRDGLGMLVEQAAEAFFLWHGMRPPAAQVLAELRGALG